MSIDNKKIFSVLIPLFWILGILLVVAIFNLKVEWIEESTTYEIEEVITGTIQPAMMSITIAEEVIFEEPVEARYGFTDDDIYMLAQLLCGDKDIHGDGEYDFVWGYLQDEMNYYEMSKVLCVVMNRVRDEGFPDTVYDVVMQKGQFADDRRIDTVPDDIALEKIGDWCTAYDRWDPGVQSIPVNHFFYDGDGTMNHTREKWR